VAASNPTRIWICSSCVYGMLYCRRCGMSSTHAGGSHFDGDGLVLHAVLTDGRLRGGLHGGLEHSFADSDTIDGSFCSGAACTINQNDLSITRGQLQSTALGSGCLLIIAEQQTRSYRIQHGCMLWIVCRSLGHAWAMACSSAWHTYSTRGLLDTWSGTREGGTAHRRGQRQQTCWRLCRRLPGRSAHGRGQEVSGACTHGRLAWDAEGHFGAGCIWHIWHQQGAAAGR
jgi:hypothetical protein